MHTRNMYMNMYMNVFCSDRWSMTVIYKPNGRGVCPDCSVSCLAQSLLTFSVTSDTGAKSMTHTRLQDRPGSLPPTPGSYMETSGRKAKKSCEMPEKPRSSVQASRQASPAAFPKVPCCSCVIPPTWIKGLWRDMDNKL